ncbi:MAG: NUDIX hydrolase [Acidimicrobiia bacterium]
MAEVVRAAGAVVHRVGDTGVEVALVHRPRYDDWSIPKGKQESGETDEMTAVREVWEETGLRGPLGLELPSTSYVDQRGRAKTVRFWLMAHDALASDPFAPNEEVDELRWCDHHAAVAIVTQEGERQVLLRAFTLLNDQ